MALNFDHVVVKADGKTAAVINEFEPVRVKSPNASVFAVHSSWEGIPNKPATFPPSPHIHDDRYYTEEETDALLEPKLEADDLQWGMMQGNIEDQADLMERITHTGTATGETSVRVSNAAAGAPLISAKVAFSGDTNRNKTIFMACGKNLIDMTAFSAYDPERKGLHIVSPASATKNSVIYYPANGSSYLIFPPGKMTISFRINADAVVGSGTRLCLRNSAGNIYSSSSIVLSAGTTKYSKTFNNTDYRYLSIFYDYSDNPVPVDFWIYDLQIEMSEEQTDYEPFRGVFYRNTLSWENLPGYCKAAEYDIVSGKFTILDDPQNPQTVQVDPIPLMSYDNTLYIFTTAGDTVTVEYFKATSEGQRMGSAHAADLAADTAKAAVIQRSVIPGNGVYSTADAPIVITAATQGSPILLQANALPRQDGSGVPSPTNIRNILPYTSIDMYYSGANQSVYKTLSLDVSQGFDGADVWGALWDVLKGRVINRYTRVYMDPSWSDWEIISSNNPNGTVFAPTSHSGLFYSWTNGNNVYAVSNAFMRSPVNVVASAPANSFYWNASGVPQIVYGEPYGGTTVEEFKAFLRQTPVYLCGAKPGGDTSYYNYPRQDIELSEGENRLWMDSGRVAIRCKLDTTLAVDEVRSDVDAITQRIENVENITGLKRYGVSGVGGSAGKLTRLYDAVGMTAMVGTNSVNTDYVNDFDNAEPFKLRKCVGTWSLEEGHAVFHVEAYYGDAGYTEDGSMGDYVAVECPLSYYYRNGNTLTISAHRYPGYRPFDIFCKEHNPEDTMQYVYIPAYTMGVNSDGHAVCLPGYYPKTGNYGTLMNAARTYKGGALGNKAYIYPSALNFYLYALMTVEFAHQSIQAYMYGVSLGTSVSSAVCKNATQFIVNSVKYRAGMCVCIGTTGTSMSIQSIYDATHYVNAATPCDASGSPTASGSYMLLEVTDLGMGYFSYTAGTTYDIVPRAYMSGEANSVVTPSGSPVENKDGLHPCKYRGFENPFGNLFITSADLFCNKQSGQDIVYYYLNDPEHYTSTDTEKPTAEDMADEMFTMLDIASTITGNGYIKAKEYSLLYPDVWTASDVSGDSGSYFADYAQVATSTGLKVARFGGAFNQSSVAQAGPNQLHFGSSPTGDFRNCGTRLWIKQG